MRCCTEERGCVPVHFFFKKKTVAVSVDIPQAHFKGLGALGLGHSYDACPFFPCFYSLQSSCAPGSAVCQESACSVLAFCRWLFFTSFDESGLIVCNK